MDFLDQIAQNEQLAPVEGANVMDQIAMQEVHPNMVPLGEDPNIPIIESEEPAGNQDSQFFQNMDFVQPPAEMPSRSDSDAQVEQQPGVPEMQDDPFGAAQEYHPPNYGASIPGFGGEIVSDMDPEEQAAIAAREQEEQERLKMLAQKDREEYQLKEERRLKAQNDLQAWHSQRQQEILKRREINFAAEQNFRDLQESFKAKENPWEKVVGNIETKAGNYPGTKDVTRLKKSILNKKADFGSLY